MTFQRICSIGALLLFLLACSRLPVEYPPVHAEQGEIRIPVSSVSDGDVHFYTYKKSGKRINFFVRTDGSGRLSTYFDACFTCSKHKKGYRREGPDLVCNECKMKFKLADEKWLNDSGCSPITLKNRQESGQIIILAVDIEKGERLFK